VPKLEGAYKMKRILVVLALLFVTCAPVFAAETPSFLASSEWLEEHIDDDNLVVLEVRYYPHRYYTIGHIPGAVQVQRFKDLGANDGGGTLMMFPSKEAFQKTLRGWGVNNDSTLVLYDDARTALASRLYYLLNLYGFDMSKVKLLNGGTVAWQSFNDLSKDEVKKPAGNVTLKVANKDLFVEWTTVYDRVVARRDPAYVLIDARPGFGYVGEKKMHAVRAGHIPGAINIVSLNGTTAGDEQVWKPLSEVAKMYKSVPKDKTIIIYCHDGFRMSLGYAQLTALGYKNVKLYNGGWGHWGNKFSLPVVKGDEPFDENFKL